MNKTILAALIVAPTLGSAEMHNALGTGILVSDPAHCELMVDVDRELHVWNVIEAGGMTLSSVKMAAPEVDCWFDEEIEISWQGLGTQLTLAACYVADRVQPTIFAFDMWPEAPGQVTVWQQGADEPMNFQTCDAPG